MNDRAIYANANALDLPIGDKSVHMIATSPPYFGLRDYGTATWEGGDPECDHVERNGRNDTTPEALARRAELYGTGQQDGSKVSPIQYRGACPKCGAIRKDAQLGMEPLHDCLAWARGDEPCGGCYVCDMRTWAREMHRVLRDDGVLFINLGDSYASSSFGDSSRKLYNLRDDLSQKELQDVCLAMFGVRFNGYPQEVDGVVPQVLQENVGQKTARKRAGAESRREQGLLPSEPRENTKKASGEASTTEVGLHRGVGRQVRLLWGNGSGVLDDRPYQRGWGVTPKNDNRPEPCEFSQDLQRYSQPGIPQGQVQSSLHELQLFLRLVGVLSTHSYTGDEIPNRVKSLFKERVTLKPKDLCMIPARVALALQADGWYLRSDIIWAKPNPMPESVTDRPTKAHEYIFLLTKSARYYWDAEAVKERGSENIKPGGTAVYTANGSTTHGIGSTTFHQMVGESGRNIRTVWNIATAPYAGAHYATWPPALVERMVKAGSSERGVCPECGKPWERVVEKSGTRATHGVNNVADKARAHEPIRANGTRHGNGSVLSTGQVGVYATSGWRPTCDHDAAPVPAIVLDPFCGSGTTLMVARQLGRIGLGFDLSLKYLEKNAAVRLGHDKLAAWGNGIKDTADYGDLFANGVNQ